MSASSPNRWRFSLRTAFLILLGSAVLLSWFARPWVLARQRAAEVEALRKVGAWEVVRNHDEQVIALVFDSATVSDDVIPLIVAHRDLGQLATFTIAVDSDGSVPEQGLTDLGVQQLAVLRKLTTLQLHGRGITDACLPTLRQLPDLWRLELVNTSVSQAAIERNFGERVDFEVRRFDALTPPTASSP